MFVAKLDYTYDKTPVQNIKWGKWGVNGPTLKTIFTKNTCLIPHSKTIHCNHHWTPCTLTMHKHDKCIYHQPLCLTLKWQTLSIDSLTSKNVNIKHDKQIKHGICDTSKCQGPCHTHFDLLFTFSKYSKYYLCCNVFKGLLIWKWGMFWLKACLSECVCVCVCVLWKSSAF